MNPEPEKAASPKSEAAVSPAPAPVPFFGGKPALKAAPPSGPGEPYIPLPDLARRRPRWLYALTAALLALAAAAGLLVMRDRAAAPDARQPAPVEAPAVPGPGSVN